MRFNIAKFGWIDNNKNGIINAGETYNWETYDGSPLMMKYEIKYLD